MERPAIVDAFFGGPLLAGPIFHRVTVYAYQDRWPIDGHPSADREGANGVGLCWVR
jgi:hypothetical protein